MIRRAFDTLYLAGGICAAGAILAICLLVSAQVGLNILARLGGPGLSYTIPSYADFAGFFLAAASFLAFPYALRMGAHIRVNLVISRLPQSWTWALELFTLALGAAISAYAAYYAVALTHESWDYGDMSTGIVAVPLWIPQLAMDAGLILLTLAFLQTFVESVLAGRPVIVDAGEA
ncbi:TRAP transporter small permease [Pseudooceanicola sp. HF7]|uniref:TRAP transporter small permease n=1 Tax=Pseudooceanicola sp. HF7 TaxID=2721560 RepID=UPI0014321C38|nr:TRAP transporter small permease [Pseudooceanicola sp. HF7]NIZ07837.1 TRAP transporter small permease [Pseudooceanicola sp. HF7]